MGIQDKGVSMYHIVWDPFHSVTRSRYQTEYSELGQRRGMLTELIVRDPNVEDSVGGANRSGHVHL